MTYDIIIIGAGPSGSSAARIAVKYGLRTLILEKEEFPRYKPCGGAVSEQALSYLDFKIPESIIEKQIFGARINFCGRAIEKRKDYRIAILISRYIFDKCLLDKSLEAGSEVKYNERVIDYKEKDSSVEIYTTNNTYESKYIIIAEGSQGKLKDRFNQNRHKKLNAISFVTEIKTDRENFPNLSSDIIDLYFGVIEGGYTWLFPHDKYLSIGIGGLSKNVGEPRHLLNTFVKERGFSLNANPVGHLIPYTGIKDNLISNRAILVGDAGGFVDSFYGEGIAYAIKSGQIAAELVAQIITNRYSAKINEFNSRCYKDFGKNLRYSLLISKLMYSYPNIFFNFLLNDKNALDYYIEIPALKRSYKSFFYWLLKKLPGILSKTF